MHRSLITAFLLIMAVPLLTVKPEADPPAWDNCLACHGDFESSLPTLSLFRPEGLGVGRVSCMECHELHDLQQFHDDWTHPVQSVGSHLDCTMCHPVVPHGTDNPPPKPSGDYSSKGCYSCHRTIEAMQNFAGGHNPAILGCIDCHPPHEPMMAQLPPLLVTSKFREEYSATYDWYGSNRQCLDCHDALSVMYQDQAGFVTYNTENYHFTHVVGGQVLCIECHNPHGSLKPALLRDELLTGELLFMINERNGGTCAVNCHGVDHDNWSYTNDVY